MTGRKPHIVGVGNALVDIVAPVADTVIASHGLTRGGMHLVDHDAAHALFCEVGPGLQQSGGSVANSIAHLADLGVAGTYLGKVADDVLGEAFRADMGALGIAAPVGTLADGSAATGRCVVLVTRDGERTMSTYLGAATAITPEDIAASFPAACDIVFVEGYLCDAPQGKAVIAEAARHARACGAKVALTPSDAGCVQRNRVFMTDFIRNHVDILIGNRAEVGALAGTQSIEHALAWAMGAVEIAAVTDSENGALVADAGGRHGIAALPVAEVVDSTGAGDAFASGFLGGIALKRSVADAGRMGAERAAAILGHFGAREAA